MCLRAFSRSPALRFLRGSQEVRSVSFGDVFVLIRTRLIPRLPRCGLLRDELFGVARSRRR